jgi:excisionase family DNA binding protein
VSTITADDPKLSREGVLLFSIPDFARELNISKRMVWRMIASGDLRSVHVGRLRRIPATELDRIAISGAPIRKGPGDTRREDVAGWVTVVKCDETWWQVNVCIPGTTTHVVYGLTSERDAEAEAADRRAPLLAAFDAGRASR